MFYNCREGEKPDSVAYFPSMDYGIDSNRSLELQDLVGKVGIYIKPILETKFYYCVRLANFKKIIISDKIMIIPRQKT